MFRQSVLETWSTFDIYWVGHKRFFEKLMQPSKHRGRVNFEPRKIGHLKNWSLQRRLNTFFWTARSRSKSRYCQGLGPSPDINGAKKSPMSESI